MKLFNKIIILLIFSTLLFGCQDLKRGFSKQNIDKGSEFLVKKKNPLETPPDFDQMPMPGVADNNLEETELNNTKIKNEINKVILKKDSDIIKKKTPEKPSGIEKEILKKIN